jgi:sterol 14-demethylase
MLFALHSSSWVISQFSQLVFQSGLQITFGPEIGKDAKAVDSAIKAFGAISDAAKPSGMVLPFLPTPSRIRTLIGGYNLYNLTVRMMDQHKADTEPRYDVLQALMDENLDTMTCVKVFISLC